MKPTVLSAVKLYFFKKSFLKEEELHHHDEQNDGKHTGEWDEKKAAEYLKRIQDKRKRLLYYLLLVVTVVFLGALTATLIKQILTLSVPFIRSIRATSLIVIAWSVLAKLEDIKTLGGSTHLEQTSSFSFKILYCFGMFLASLSLFLM